MCDPVQITAWAAAASAATGAGSLAVAANKKPKGPSQEAKKPDAGLSDKDRRAKLLAQLAAGASRNNPSGGTAGNPSTGSVLLGG